MKRRTGKKGAIEWEKIAAGIIVIAVLVLLIMAIYLYFRPNLSKLGEYVDSAFGGLPKDIFGTEKGKTPVVEKDIIKALENLNCDNAEKALLNVALGTIVVKEKEEADKIVFEKCLKETKCAKAEVHFNQLSIQNTVDKDNKILDLVKCYAAIGKSKDSTEITSLMAKLSEEQKNVAISIILEYQNNKADLETYQNAVTILTSKTGDKEEAKKLLNTLKDNTLLKDAVQFWLDKIDNDAEKCKFTEIRKGIKFPIVEITGSHRGEDIRLHSLFEKGLCEIKRDKKNLVISSSMKNLFEEYGGENDAKPLIDQIIKEYDINEKCHLIGDNEAKCNDYGGNEFENIKDKMDLNTYKQLRCHYVDVKWSQNNLCKPCTDIKSCEEYGGSSDCMANPCGIQNVCNDAGFLGITDKCVSK